MMVLTRENLEEMEVGHTEYVRGPVCDTEITRWPGGFLICHINKWWDKLGEEHRAVSSIYIPEEKALYMPSRQVMKV